jgi:hypothetical protein
MGGRRWKIRTGNPNFQLTVFEEGLNELRTSEQVFALLESQLTSTASIAGPNAEVRRSTKARTRAKVTLTNGKNTAQEAADGSLFAALSATGAKIGKPKKERGLE